MSAATRALLLAALAAAGCASQSTSSSSSSSLNLTPTWPASTSAAPYDDIYQRWTRRAEDSEELVQTLSVSATLHSGEFRAAYLRERARRLLLGPDEVAVLADKEKRDLTETWEFEILVATAKPDLNDLHKVTRPAHGQPGGVAANPRSMWRLALVGDDQRAVEPISVQEDRRHREDLQAYFPDLKPFYHAYVVRFPRATADGRPLVGERGRLALQIGSTVGRVELKW